jgi:predicted metalloprotease with PDZ domain
MGRGKAPTSFTLNSGKHSVQVVLDGYQDWVQEISVEAGETASLTANLRPVTTTLAETPAANTLSTNPNDIAVGSYMESPTPSVRPEYTPSQTKNESKLVPVANSSVSDSSGWIGVTGMTGAYGIIITDLASDGPAREAGLKIADTIIGVDETSVKMMQMMTICCGTSLTSSQSAPIETIHLLI